MYTIKSFYKSKEWLDLLELLKIQRLDSSGEIICEHCGKAIYKKYDCIGHHKAEAFDLVDAEQTKIIFDAQLYQVDKGTSPMGVWGNDMVDYFVGGN